MSESISKPKMSLRKLAAMEPEGNLPAVRNLPPDVAASILAVSSLEVPDNRATQLESHGVVDEAFVETIKEVLGETFLLDRNKIRQLVSIRAEVRQQWASARDAFLAIGRSLLSLESILSVEEYRKLKENSDRIFPFSATVASQLKQVARNVEAGRIPIDACPGSWGTAYQITLLSDDQLRLAQEKGLVRANVTRSEIARFRQEVGSGLRSRLSAEDALHKEKVSLQSKELRLKAELETLRRRLSEIEVKLKKVE